MRTKAFTLIELLVVISMIALLSSVVLAALNSARTKAQYARARQEMYQFTKAAAVAQGEAGVSLRFITGSACSECPCRSIGSLINISTGHACYTGWTNVLSTVQANSGGSVTGLTNMTRDPWGSPYLMDENEEEGGAPDCRQDLIKTAGPNGILGDSDDASMSVPLRRNPCP